MSHKIIIDVSDIYDELLRGVSSNQIGILLRDALYEFAERSAGPGKPQRRRAQAYVDWRYPALDERDNPQRPEECFSESFRAEKVEQVRKRCQWADALRSGVIEIEGSWRCCGLRSVCF